MPFYKMEWTLTTFLYELDRSSLQQKYKRPFSNYVERLQVLLRHATIDPTCKVQVFVDEPLQYLKHQFPTADIIVKPRIEWASYRFKEQVKRVVKNYTGSYTFPEYLMEDYTLMVLSKLDAMKYTSEMYPGIPHIWLDAGYRWTLDFLQKPNWKKSDCIYLSSALHGRYMGGCWGGSDGAIKQICNEFDKTIPVLISENTPFTEETVFKRIVELKPELFYTVRLYSKGLFKSGPITNMVQMMVAGESHDNMRSLFSKGDVAILAFGVALLVSFYIVKYK